MDNETKPIGKIIDGSANLDLQPGMLISNRYELLSLLGQGGVGLAFKALDKQLHRAVTIKFLLPERVTNPKDRVRFQREAMTAAQLQHQGIAKVFTFELDELMRPFLVLEFIDGQTLAQRIEQEGQLPIDETLAIFIRIADALAYAHSRGVLHRDIKPSNIMLDNRIQNQASAVKLVDFGLAKLIADEGKPPLEITNTGELVGSPLYMSPEQARGAQLDNRSDLYSYGCTMYESLTGSPPHLGQTVIATILKHETDKPLALGEASLGRDIPDDLEHLVAKLLAANPNDRYQSASDLLVDLRKIGSQAHALPIEISSSPEEKLPLVRRRSTVGWKFAIVLFLITLFPVGMAWLVTKHEQPRPSTDLFSAPFELKEGTEKIWLEADQFLDKARRFRANGQYSEAIKECRKAISNYDSIFERTAGLNRDPDQADTLMEMTDCYLMLGDYAGAKDSIQRFAKICENIWGNHNKSQAETLTSTGTHYLRLNGIDAARVYDICQPLFDRSEYIITRRYGSNSLEFGLCMTRQADACLDAGLVQQAKSRCDKIIRCLTNYSAGSAAPISEVLATMSRVYSQSGDFKKLDYVSHLLVRVFEADSDNDKPAMAPSLLIAANALMSAAPAGKMETTFASRSLYLYQAGLKNYEHAAVSSEDASRRKTELLLASYQTLATYYKHEGERGKSGNLSTAELYYKRALFLLKDKPGAKSKELHKELESVSSPEVHH